VSICIRQDTSGRMHLLGLVQGWKNAGMNLTDLRQLGKRLVAETEAAMTETAGFNLKPTEVTVLTALFANGKLSIGDIAKHAGFAQSRVSTAVASLCRRGYTDIERDATDGRKTMVVLGARAEEVTVEAMQQEALPLVATLFPESSADQAEQTMRQLECLRKALDARAAGRQQSAPMESAP
jgi:DNA-binding MarR family transcriptional regulator